MKKKVSVAQAVNAYELLGSAKYQKMDDADKIKVWKITRLLRPLATRFSEDKADAIGRLVSDSIRERLPKAQEYERISKEGTGELPMTEGEYKAFLTEYAGSVTLVKKALDEILCQEEELDAEFLTEESFGLLMASNDWSMRQVEALEFMVG